MDLSLNVTRFFLCSRLLCMALLCALFGFPAQAQADPPLQPGFRTLGVWEPSYATRLDFAIWYPTLRKPATINYGDWSFQASRGATPIPGRHPLLLLSHDTSGSRFSLHTLATTLARRGFIVIAPTHLGDNETEMNTLFTLKQITNRVEQLQAALDSLLSTPEISEFIDTRRIGLLGVGAGASATLMLAGASINPAGWEGYCQKQQDLIPQNPYCTPWARQRMDIMTSEKKPKLPATDPRIKVFAAVAPWYSMLFTPETLTRVKAPLLLLGADKMAASPLTETIALRDSLPVPPVFAVIPEANAVTLSSACAEALQNVPELCRQSHERTDVQEDLALAASSFFLQHLGQNN